MPIVDFGFVTGCTIEISVLGKGSSEIWFAMSSQTISDSIPTTPAEHVTLDDAMIHGTNSNLRSDGGKNDLILKCAANGAGARSPFSQASLFSESDQEEESIDSYQEEESITPLDDSDTDDGSDGEIFCNNQRKHPLLHVESAEVVAVKCGALHFTAVLTSIEHVHLPAAKITLSKQLNCAKRAQQKIVYYFSSPTKPQQYQLISSRYISPISDIYDINALRCNPDHIQQAEIFRAQHRAYHASTMECNSLPAMDAVDEHKQVFTEQLLSQTPGSEALSLPAHGSSPSVVYQIPTVEHIIATRHASDTQQLTHIEYLVKWVGRTLADNSWETISNLGYNASFLIQNFDATRTGQQIWKTIGPRNAWIGNPHQKNCMVEVATWSLPVKVHPGKKPQSK
jgi:hypothetical protein